MKHSFKFDKATGTMKPANDAVAQGIEANIHNEVKEIKSTISSEPPKFEKKKEIIEGKTQTATPSKSLVKMKRVLVPTPVQLINDLNMPEAYLDSINMGVMMFREREDYDICQITDERTGKVLAYIGGYALQFNFNMEELNNLERIEQCLQGLTKLFRHKIMTQNLKGADASK